MSDDEPILPTETAGDLNPPPPKPPITINADAADPDPKPRPWTFRRRDVPNSVGRAIDSALDTLDKLGDAIRSATRPA